MALSDELAKLQELQQRGALTDEYLRAMKLLWTQERPSFEGPTVQFSRIAFEPRCVQQPHVPIWVGGSGPAPLRRARRGPRRRRRATCSRSCR